MKLRILGNSLRLRLSQSEVSSISNGHTVAEQVDFIEQPFCYELKLGEASSISANFNDGCISIGIPKTDLLKWAQSDQVSLEGFADGVKILVEKDFQCLTERAEDESDLFPNPNTNC